MKIVAAIIFPILLSLFTSPSPENAPSAEISGAWTSKTDSGSLLLIISDNYCSITAFDEANKKFFYTKGGVLKQDAGSSTLLLEFHSQESTEVGRKTNPVFSLKNNELDSDIDGVQRKWLKVDDAKTPLTGCWRISRRVNDGETNEIKPNPRKTLKILSGTKFQWMAINTETGQFFGTGGGSYTFKDGKYTEHLEFFSRDNSRVGASLTFDGKVENNIWYHKGRSSKGDPVDEQWVKH